MKKTIAILGVMLLSMTMMSQRTSCATEINPCIKVNWYNDEVFYDDIIVMQRVKMNCVNHVMIHFPYDFKVYVFNDAGQKIHDLDFVADGNPMPGHKIPVDEFGGSVVVVMMSKQLTMARRYEP